MKGLEIAESYYYEYGLPAIKKEFPELLEKAAFGLIGCGSECFGYDDEISRDHDFEPGFCIFLPGEDAVDRKTEFRLSRLYAGLPKEYMGVKKSLMAPVGGSRRGVIRLSDFLSERLGSPKAELSEEQWISVPDWALSELCNGKLFSDESDLLTSFRKSLSKMPRDVLLKKLSGSLIVMAQSGQYNYARCVRHGEPDAAQLCCFEFVKAAMQTLFLLAGRYMPYYKWSFRALRELQEEYSRHEFTLSMLLQTPNSEGYAEEKYNAIEAVASDIISMLIERGLTKASCGDLEKHAYSVNDEISDGNIRALGIFSAV